MHRDEQMTDEQSVEALVLLALWAAESALRSSPEGRPELRPAPRKADGKRGD